MLQQNTINKFSWRATAALLVKARYLSTFICFLPRYLYVGAMPLPVSGNGVMPIFYFLMAKHEEPTFKQCLTKFYEDVKKLRDQTPEYKNKNLAPYQIITDMSLVIFRPCIGR